MIGKATKNKDKFQFWASINSRGIGKHHVSPNFVHFIGCQGTKEHTWPPVARTVPSTDTHFIYVCWLNKWAKNPASFAFGEPAKIVICGWQTKQYVGPFLTRTACRILTCMISFFHFKGSYQIKHRKTKVHKAYVNISTQILIHKCLTCKTQRLQQQVNEWTTWHLFTLW